jgi:hypothetical protein
VTGYSGKAISLHDEAFVSTRQNMGRWLSGSFTVAFRIKTTAIGNSNLNLAPMVTGSRLQPNFRRPNEHRVLLIGALDLTGKIGVQFADNGASVKSASAINSGAWQHVTITRDAGTGEVKIYINKTLSSSGTLESGYLCQRCFSIGRPEHAELSNYLNASLDAYNLYNRVLSATEVSNL